MPVECGSMNMHPESAHRHLSQPSSRLDLSLPRIKSPRLAQRWKSCAPPPPALARSSGGPASAVRLHRSGKTLWIVVAVLAFVLVGGGFAAWRYLPKLFAGQREDLLYHTVKDEALQVTVKERGALEAARNDDLICLVKASGRGSMTATTIKKVIDDGTQVKK